MHHSNLEKFFLAAIVESSYDSIITIDFQTIITSWNKAAERLYGYSAEEAIGKSLTMLTLPEDFTEILSNIDKIRNSKQVVVFHTERVKKQNEQLILEVVMSPVKNHDGNIVGISTVARDVTERDRAARALQEKQNLQRLIEAQEDERKRIAHDLHDGIGQLLTVLRLQLELTKKSCNGEQVCDKIEEIQIVAEEIDREVDFLAWELRPSALDDLGLYAAIGNFVQQWSQHSGIKTEMLRSNLAKLRFAPTVETNLYRNVQEALNNIHKHARAKNVEVILDKRDDLIVLIIEDDGIGLDLSDKKKHSSGLGLTGMKERVALMGGTFEIESEIGRGTPVYVRIQASAIRNNGAER